MKNLILNGGYNSKSILFEKGKGDQIYFKGKKLTDLSHCSGSLIFGHNNSILVKSLKSYIKNKVSIFSHPNIYAVKFSKLIIKNQPRALLLHPNLSYSWYHHIKQED